MRFPKRKYYPGIYADEVKRKRLHAACWKIVSEIVRKSRIVNFYAAPCFTCGKLLHWKDLQAGHYIHGGTDCWSLLDFCFDNLRPQCVRCNKYLNGNLGIYGQRLEAEIGPEKMQDLKILKHAQNDMTIDDYKKLKTDLKDKLEKINAEKLRGNIL